MRAGQVRGQIIARVDRVKQSLPVACSEIGAPFAALSITFAHPIPALDGAGIFGPIACERTAPELDERGDRQIKDRNADLSRRAFCIFCQRAQDAMVLNGTRAKARRTPSGAARR